MKKIIIAGSRKIDKFKAFYIVVELMTRNLVSLDEVELVTGCCPSGPDQVPFMFKRLEKMGPPPHWDNIREFPADWDKHGKAAGPIRNRQMAEYADELWLIWDGKSKGSWSMFKEMDRLKKPAIIVQLDEDGVVAE